ncbi:MAG: hypothetical protein HY717_05870 [Planctomycetes bacterium]|nr:hypothetical protein [Planctomycetota bacterium]
MTRLLKYLVALALAAGLWNRADGTALDDYVAAPDANYRYRLIQKLVLPVYTQYSLDMDSQIWRPGSEVSPALWSHRLFIIVPQTVKSTTAILWIGEGDNGSIPLINPVERALALNTQTVVASLRFVPNQPLVFTGEGRSRKEDQILAYTFARFLDSGDGTWPALLPMVKSAVRAMDTVQAFLGGEADPAFTVENFVVTGASKRGWTSWLTAAVDARVKAIVPVVIDVLNIDEQMAHHRLAYEGVTLDTVGGYAVAIQDYVRENVIQRMNTPEGQALLKIIDPFEYRERLTLPKYLVNSADDQFFVPDSAQFYFKDLPGPKYLRYVPNIGHFGLQPGEVADGVQAFYEAVLSGKPLPEFTWTIEGDGLMRIETADPPLEARLWQATNPVNRDFRIGTGVVWKSSVLTGEGDGIYRARAAGPTYGQTAYFVELKFPSSSPIPYTFTTEVSIFCSCPVLDFTVTPAAGIAPLEAAFDASATIAAPGSQTLSYHWDFGDGKTGEGLTAANRYDGSGRFIATLTTTDDLGRKASIKKGVSVLCPAADLSPWTPVDIGAPAYPGSSRFEESAPGDGGSAWRVCAGGKGIGGKEDECFFVYQGWRGDFRLTARVAEILKLNRSAILGVMFREGIDPGARFGAVAIEKPSDLNARNRFVALHRPAAGDYAELQTGEELETPGGWLRILRKGVSLTFWSSPDGNAWGAPVQQVAMEGLPETLLLGIAAAGSDLGAPDQFPFEPLQALIADLAIAPLGESFLRGDANLDEVADLSDAIFSLEFLFLGTREPECRKSLDADDNGVLEITDPIRLLEHLFLGAAAPPPPFPACGLDSTSDSLPCETPPSC